MNLTCLLDSKFHSDPPSPSINLEKILQFLLMTLNLIFKRQNASVQQCWSIVFELNKFRRQKQSQTEKRTTALLFFYIVNQRYYIGTQLLQNLQSLYTQGIIFECLRFFGFEDGQYLCLSFSLNAYKIEFIQFTNLPIFFSPLLIWATRKKKI